MSFEDVKTVIGDQWQVLWMSISGFQKRQGVSWSVTIIYQGPCNVEFEQSVKITDISPLKTKVNTSCIWRFSSYLAVNSLHLAYKNSVNAV
jgi:hypothetical protein